MSDSNTERKPLRETRSCSVPTCRNKRVGKKDGAGPSFHRFPKDPSIREAWVKRCRIDDDVNLDSGSVCSDHFDFDDFERSYQKQLMGIERRPMLKKNVIPHLNLPMLRMKRKPEGEFLNRLKNRFQDLIQVNDSNSNMSKKNYKIEVKTVNVLPKTISVLPKNDLSQIDSIILDDSDLESLCIQTIDENVEPHVTSHSSIENIQIEPDYKALYHQTLSKYEKLKSRMLEVESNLAKEKKRADDYQSMLTKIFAEGEIQLVCKKEK